MAKATRQGRTAKVGRPTTAAAVQFPTERTAPRNKLGEYSILVYGREKIGKTSLASCFPDALFISFEPGTRALSVYEMQPDNWKAFRSIVLALKTETRFKTIVIDTVDLAYRQCEEYVCKREGIDHPSDEDWGKGWAAVKNEFAGTLNKLLSQSRGVVFVSHETERSIKRRGGRETTRIVPTMAGQARTVIEPMIDIWAYYHYTGDDGTQRVIRVVGDDLISAGHRTRGHFKNIASVPAGENEQEAYANFVSAFNNEPVEGATTINTNNTTARRRKSK